MQIYTGLDLSRFSRRPSLITSERRHAGTCPPGRHRAAVTIKPYWSPNCREHSETVQLRLHLRVQ